MNQTRRKDVERAIAMIEEAKSIFETAQSDEQDYHDNMPDSLQAGDKGERAQAAADALQEAMDGCDESIEAAGRAIE